MATTINILRKVGAKIEDTAGTYDAPNTLIPFTSFTEKQSFDMIKDESIVGVAFEDLPLQGVRHVMGSINGQVDKDSIDPIFEQAFGTAVGTVYTCPADKNENTLSFVGIDAVKTYKYAGNVLNNFELKSDSEGALIFSADVIGWKAETRDDTSFPSISTNPSVDRFLFQHAGGTNGYARIGDQANALASGDNQNVSGLSFGINWNFAEQFFNDQGTLQLLSNSGGRANASFSFKIARHDADTWHTAINSHTALQAAVYFYKSATATLLIEVPNFVISDLTSSEDDVNTLDVVCTVARNGTGTSYSNANMEFVSPIRATIVNS